MFTLVAGFAYPDSPAQKLLDQMWPMGCSSLYLRSDIEESKQKLNVFFQQVAPDNIIIFSERKDIDKPVIELAACDERTTLTSNFNLKKLQKAFQVFKVPYETNDVPVPGQANDAYFYCLRRDNETYSPTSIVSISLPSLKNFHNFDQFSDFMTEYINSESRALASMFYRSWL